LGELKAKSFDENLRRYKTNWIQHLTRMDSNRMAKVMLNYGQNRRRRLGTLLNRILDESETGLNHYGLSLLFLLSYHLLLLLLLLYNCRRNISYSEKK
jgi:hypothetical protein